MINMTTLNVDTVAKAESSPAVAGGGGAELGLRQSTLASIKCWGISEYMALPDNSGSPL